MTQDELDFIKDLSETDAKRIIAQARNEAAMDYCALYDTTSFRAYVAALELLRRASREYPEVFTMDTIRFGYYGHQLHRG